MIVTILVCLGIILMVYLLSRVVKYFQFSKQARLQLAIVNEFLLNPSQKEWILGCANEDQIIEEGQDRLWEAANILREKMLDLSHNNFMIIDPNDTGLLDQMMTINKIVLAMTMAKQGDIDFVRLSNLSKDKESTENEN